MIDSERIAYKKGYAITNKEKFIKDIENVLNKKY